MNEQEFKYGPKTPVMSTGDTQKKIYDSVNQPEHYTHPSGVECITITEHMNFNVGNAIKYLWRAGKKYLPMPSVCAGATEISQHATEQHIQDLRKAAWYINREIQRMSKEINK